MADAVVSPARGRRRSGRSAVAAPERCTRLGGEAVVTTRLERMTKRSERRAQRKRAARSTFRVSASAASPPNGPTFTSDDDYRAEGERALRRLTFAVCLSMVSFGCATGAIAGALLHLESANTALGALTAGVKSRVIAATPLGALLGALVAGPFGDKTGRRSSILVGNALFLLGAGLMFTAVTPTQLTCGRLCAGLAVGFSTSLCTVYIGECAPAAQRGQLSSYAPLGVTAGILASYFASLPLTNVAGGWRLTLAMCALPAAAQLCIKDWLVESPRWLAERGDVAGAQASLNALGQRHVEAGSLKSSFRSSGPVDPGEHEQGGDSSPSSKRRGIKKRVTFASLVTERRYRKPAAIACGLNVAQQLCGINVVVYFAPRVLNELGFQPSVAIGFVCAIGVLQFVVGSKIGAVIDTYGRRPVALGGIAGLAAGLAMLATSSHLRAPWIAVLGILVFRLSFSASMAPIPYVVSAEVFPSEARSVGAAAGAAAREVANVVVTG